MVALDWYAIDIFHLIISIVVPPPKVITEPSTAEAKWWHDSEAVASRAPTSWEGLQGLL